MTPPNPSLTKSIPNRRQKVNALVYVCSGAADVGELTDRAARQLDRQGIAAMSCLASIGARDDDITFNAQLADQMLLIDGCPKACARRTFEQAGLKRPWLHFDLSEIGLRKSCSAHTAENIQKVVDKAAAMLAAVTPPSKCRPGAPGPAPDLPPHPTGFAALLAGALLGRGVTNFMILLAGWAGLWMLASLANHFFFRDPAPTVPAAAGLAVAPAHGRVDVIEDTEEPEFMQVPARRVSIFLSVLDVHVQSAPVAGRVACVRHRPGRFFNALRAESAEQNEQVVIGMDWLEFPGERVVVRQIAGAIARRIECWVNEGEVVFRGQRLGQIRYGSRCDLYLPQSWSVRIRPGDHVVGGQTVVAKRQLELAPTASAEDSKPATVAGEAGVTG